MTPFKKPPEIEELGELSWKRVENRVFTELSLDRSLGASSTNSERTPASGRIRWAAGLGMACAAAALLLVFVSREAKLADRAPTRSRVVTAESASAVVVGDADIEVARESAIWIDSDGSKVEITLDRGSVDCRVAPREGRPPFLVHAGNARVEVVGTDFSVSRAGDSARVRVREGVVKVIAAGDVHQVRAGEVWPREEVVMEMQGEVIPQKAEPRKRASKPREMRGARTTMRHRAESQSARERKDGAAQESSARETEPSAAELYARAAHLESSDPAAAIALYRRIAGGEGAWAANALFAHARLELERGRRRAAMDLLEGYLRRFPKGANAQDAKRLLER